MIIEVSQEKQREVSLCLQSERLEGERIILRVTDKIFAPLLSCGDEILLRNSFNAKPGALSLVTVNNLLILARTTPTDNGLTLQNILTGKTIHYSEQEIERQELMILSEVKSFNIT